MCKGNPAFALHRPAVLPPRKGGAGGHYTWGSATDVDADAAAVSAGPVAIESKVTTGAPVMPEVVPGSNGAGDGMGVRPGG